MDFSKELLEEMKRLAREAARNSYCRYSRFPVGAAVLTETGGIFTGCNVENVSYGLTNCAERTAVFKAVSEGCREIRVVVVYTPTGRATLPCGACRQVIHEFGPNALVKCFCDTDHRVETTLDRLLPHAFASTRLPRLNGPR
jgi:cytidine deaminase